LSILVGEDEMMRNPTLFFIDRHATSKIVVLLLAFLFLLTLVLPFNVIQAEEEPSNLTVVKNIELSSMPKAMAVNSKVNKVYVGTENSLVVINGDTDTVEKEIPFGWSIIALEVNPQTNYIYVGGQSNITVLNGNSYAIIGTIYQTGFPYSFAVNPITNLVYTASSTAFLGKYDNVNIYNGDTLQLVNTVEIPYSNKAKIFHSIKVAVNPKTNMVYATWSGSSSGGSIFQIDANNNNAVAAESYYYGFGTCLMVNSYTNYVYVDSSIFNDDNLTKLTQNYAGDLKAIDSIHNRLYTMDSKVLNVLNGNTQTVLSSLTVGSSKSIGASEVAVNPETSKLYLGYLSYNSTDFLSNQTAVIMVQPIDEFTFTTQIGAVTVIVALSTITLIAFFLKKRILEK
jgi:hypothetical protein